MTAGIPGTGIGGVFYLLSAIAMPFVELYRALRGRSTLAHWRLIAKQWSMAMGIIGGMWLLGLGLGMLMGAETHVDFDYVREIHGHITNHVERLTSINVFHIAPLLMACATLFFILIVTQILRLFYRPVARA